MMNISMLIGSLGVLLLLSAFFFNLINKLHSQSFLYSFLNFFGATFAGIASYLINYTPFVILETVWALVALVGMIRFFKR